MAKAPTLTPGSILTLLELFKLAAAHKGLKIYENPRARHAQSKPIKTYELDEGLIKVLDERRIRRQARPDTQQTVFTLIDENPQEPTPGFCASNYWNFKEHKEGTPQHEGRFTRYNLRVELHADLMFDPQERGITLWPKAMATLVGPVDHLPNFRMFKALVEQDPDAPAVAKEIAASDGYIVVAWTDLGLGGLRPLNELFAEFSRRRDELTRLGERGEIFDPAPFGRQLEDPGLRRFVIESAQPRIMRAWKEQLAAYRESLVA